MLKYSDPMKFLVKYLLDVRSELKKVTWPKAADVTKLTITVLLITIISGIYLGILDFGFTKLLERVLGV